jgi:aminoglycoside phosphotransferase
VKTLLAADPMLPQRDLLLDGARVAPLLEQRLGLERPVELTRCEIARVKYRVGESLRVRYAVETRERRYAISCRAFVAGRSETAYRRALGHLVPTGELRPLAWMARLETVFWTFPNDRKLRLDSLRELPALLGPDLRSLHLVAYAPEKSATIGCDGGGRRLAYAKVYAGNGAGRSLALHERLAQAGMTVPRTLAAAPSLLLVAPLAGRPLIELDGARLVAGHRLLGAAVARLHGLPPPDRARFRRLDPDRVHAAAELVARARPDVAEAARLVVERAKLELEEPMVCVHGDLHPKNVLVRPDRIGIIDLDQTAGGPPSADIGGLLAGLRYARATGRLDPTAERDCAEAFLDGYESVRPLPPPKALRRATASALLAERALRAVNRVRPEGLAALPQLLDEALELADA